MTEIWFEIINKQNLLFKMLTPFKLFTDITFQEKISWKSFKVFSDSSYFDENQILNRFKNEKLFYKNRFKNDKKIV